MLERLRAHLEHKTTDLSAYALKVPAEHYVSDDQLALEVDALFKQRPVLVALTPHIPNEGDYLTHEVIDTSLLLVRDSSGVARAYINACRHRERVLRKARGPRPLSRVPFMRGTGGWMAALLPGQTVMTDSLRQMLGSTNCLSYPVTKQQD